MKISLSNLKMTSKKIKNTILKNAKPITILIPTESYDYASIKTSYMPNFIHSLDASNIHLLISNLCLHVQSHLENREEMWIYPQQVEIGESHRKV